MYEADWNAAYYKGVGTTIDIRPVAVVADEATVVEVVNRESDSFGEYYEGDGEISLVFRVGDRYFRKTGYQSSYGEDRSWDGEIVEVFPETRTITAFKTSKP